MVEEAWTVPRIVGRNIREIREARGMTQRDLGLLASGAAWPRQTVSRMEAGDRTFVAAEVFLVAHLLGVSVDRLFDVPSQVAHVEVSERLSISTAELRPRDPSEGATSARIDASRRIVATVADSLVRSASLVSRLDEDLRAIREDLRREGGADV